MRDTRAVIDLERLERNHRRLRSAHTRGRLMIVLKANAYGHGMVPVARFLAGLGQDQITAGGLGQDAFAVAGLDEALELRRAGIEGRILLLGASELDDPTWTDAEAAAAGLELTVASLHHLEAAARAVGSKGPLPGGLEIHLKLDTGMGRIGLRSADLEPAAALLKATPGLRLRGVYTHFAEAENLASDFCDVQYRAFGKMTALLLRDHTGPQPERHLCNSAALLREPRYHGDYARVGYALWAPLIFGAAGEATGEAAGDAAEPEPPLNAQLEPVLTLLTRVSHVKTMAAGDTVGYGRTHTCRAGERIATLPIGYGDGYFRQMSNRGFVSLRGKRHPIVGNVSMDQITVSLGGDPAEIGDEVILLGGGEAGIPVAEMAGWLQTIDYEVLTQLSVRIPREYVYTGEVWEG